MEAFSQQTNATVTDVKIAVTLTYFEMCLIQISLSRQLQRATARRYDPLEVQYALLTLTFLPLLRLHNRLSTEAGHLRELAQTTLRTDVQVHVSFAPEELGLLIGGLEQYRGDLLMEDARLGPAFTSHAGSAEPHRLPPFSTDNGKLLRLAPLITHLCALKSERTTGVIKGAMEQRIEAGWEFVKKDAKGAYQPTKDLNMFYFDAYYPTGPVARRTMGLFPHELSYAAAKAHVRAILEGKVKSTGSTPRKPAAPATAPAKP